MERSYAVAWQDGDGHQYAGRLDLGRTGLHLEGGNGSGPVIHDLVYARLADVRITRQLEERLSGRPTLVVRELDGRTIRIACIGEPGALPELVEFLTRQLAS